MLAGTIDFEDEADDKNSFNFVFQIDISTLFDNSILLDNSMLTDNSTKGLFICCELARFTGLLL